MGTQAPRADTPEPVDPDGPAEAGVYLLAIVRGDLHVAYRHAKHYLGWSVHIRDRVAAHRRGTGARFTQVLVGNGYGLRVVQWWPGDRELERQLKLAHHAPRYCPLCRGGRCVVDDPARFARSASSVDEPSAGAHRIPRDPREAVAVATALRWEQERLWTPVPRAADLPAPLEGLHRTVDGQAGQEGCALYGDTVIETSETSERLAGRAASRR